MDVYGLHGRRVITWDIYMCFLLCYGSSPVVQCWMRIGGPDEIVYRFYVSFNVFFLVLLLVVYR
jgi:hypothetical protein